MKVLIYVNKEKDLNNKSLNALKKELDFYEIEYDVVFNESEISSTLYDALYVIGGDGTILRRTEYANKNGIPIIGINAGKLGFLSEFEQTEIVSAVKLFAENKLKNDQRNTMQVYFDGENYLALNDVVVQRIYNECETSGMIIGVSVDIDGVSVDKITGDGVIVATPTGSTAYSLSAGGAILAPGINALVMTPIAAHSFNQRSLVFSADSTCTLELKNGSSAGLFVDGKFIKKLNTNEKVCIKKAEKPTVFLRKENTNFYDILTHKINEKDNVKND